LHAQKRRGRATGCRRSPPTRRPRSTRRTAGADSDRRCQGVAPTRRHALTRARLST
jgi:hypothetical protein